jgi:hypothetical protein
LQYVKLGTSTWPRTFYLGKKPGINRYAISTIIQLSSLGINLLPP